MEVYRGNFAVEKGLGMGRIMIIRGIVAG